MQEALKSLGAYSQLDTLMSFKAIGKHLSLKKNRRALQQQAGGYLAIKRGRGMEFEDVRQYVAGDDIRHIDWRVTARMGNAHTKQFRQEQQIPSLLFIDQRQTMFFGSQQCMKSVLACDIAALIAWSALNNGDQVGAIIAANNGNIDIRPKQQRKNVLSLLQQLCEANQQLNAKQVIQPEPLSEVLTTLQRLAKPGSQVFIISDFHDYDEHCEKTIRLLSQHCDTIAIKVFDALETQLPKAGTYTARAGEKRVQFNSSSKSVRNQYQAAFEQHQQYLQKSLQKYRVPMISVSTEQCAFSALKPFLGAM